MTNNIQQFLKEVLVIDTETTGLLDKEDSEIIEIAAGKYDSSNELSIEDRLFGSVSPMPPEASAVNYISNRMIEGLPTLADDRSWDQEGWGKRVADGFFHYYPPYHNRAVCQTTQVKPDRPGLFLITRPLRLCLDSELSEYAVVCRTCENIKRAKEAQDDTDTS